MRSGLIRVKQISWLAMMAISLTGCATSIISKEDAFPKMYQAKPIAILVVPAINNSTAAEAPDYYSTTIAEPFTRMGYYVLPIEVTNSAIDPLLKVELDQSEPDE
jgi:hypothetical protein